MSDPSAQGLALIVKLHGLALREVMRSLSVSQARQCAAGLQAGALELLAAPEPLDAVAEETVSAELSALKAALHRDR